MNIIYLLLLLLLLIRKGLPDVIGINNAGNIIAHALSVGIPLKLV